MYIKIRLERTLWDNENMFFIIGVSYKRLVNYVLANDWGMKISSL